jgi:hypothetical protein
MCKKYHAEGNCWDYVMSKREHYGSPRRFISIGFPLLSHYAKTLMGKRKGEEIKRVDGCVWCDVCVSACVCVCVCGGGGGGEESAMLYS